MTSVIATPLIDWHALFQVFYVSCATGIGIVALFSVGVYSLSLHHRESHVVRAAQSELRHDFARESGDRGDGCLGLLRHCA